MDVNSGVRWSAGGYGGKLQGWCRVDIVGGDGSAYLAL